MKRVTLVRAADDSHALKSKSKVVCVCVWGGGGHRGVRLERVSPPLTLPNMF